MNRSTVAPASISSGAQPTLAEQRQFADDLSPTRRREAIDRLLAGEEFGANWANYWRDTIAFRIPPPELTYLNYAPFNRWFAEQFNSNTPWDQITCELLTATGKIQDQPAATFVGYHQAEPTNLAAETSRIFLGQQILCAQCHDHPSDHWTRRQFHELAAFFAGTKAKLAQNDGAGTVVLRSRSLPTYRLQPVVVQLLVLAPLERSLGTAAGSIAIIGRGSGVAFAQPIGQMKPLQLGKP